MDLFCEKYKIKMIREGSVCTHLDEYCKFRGACIINFLTCERQREERRHKEPDGEDRPEDPGHLKEIDK